MKSMTLIVWKYGDKYTSSAPGVKALEFFPLHNLFGATQTIHEI
jgi:hypothetical protein